MLRPTIYVAPRDLDTVTAQWRAAEARLAAEQPNDAKTTDRAREPRQGQAVEEDPLVAV